MWKQLILMGLLASTAFGAATPRKFIPTHVITDGDKKGTKVRKRRIRVEVVDETGKVSLVSEARLAPFSELGNGMSLSDSQTNSESPVPSTSTPIQKDTSEELGEPDVEYTALPTREDAKDWRRQRRRNEKKWERRREKRSGSATQTKKGSKASRRWKGGNPRTNKLKGKKGRKWRRNNAASALHDQLGDLAPPSTLESSHSPQKADSEPESEREDNEFQSDTEVVKDGLEVLDERAVSALDRSKGRAPDVAQSASQLPEETTTASVPSSATTPEELPENSQNPGGSKPKEQQIKPHDLDVNDCIRTATALSVMSQLATAKGVQQQQNKPKSRNERDRDLKAHFRRENKRVAKAQRAQQKARQKALKDQANARRKCPRSAGGRRRGARQQWGKGRKAKGKGGRAGGRRGP